MSHSYHEAFKTIITRVFVVRSARRLKRLLVEFYLGLPMSHAATGRIPIWLASTFSRGSLRPRHAGFRNLHAAQDNRIHANRPFFSSYIFLSWFSQMPFQYPVLSRLHFWDVSCSGKESFVTPDQTYDSPYNEGEARCTPPSGFSNSTNAFKTPMMAPASARKASTSLPEGKRILRSFEHHSSNDPLTSCRVSRR